MSLPIRQEVALPGNGAVLHRVNNPLYPEYLHSFTLNLHLLQTQLALATNRYSEFTITFSEKDKKQQLHLLTFKNQTLNERQELLTNVVWMMRNPWSREMKVM